MDDVNDFLSEGYSERKAIRMSLNKNRHVLDEIWDNESDMETDEDSESEDKERQDDDNDDSDEAWLTYFTFALYSNKAWCFISYFMYSIYSFYKNDYH